MMRQHTWLGVALLTLLVGCNSNNSTGTSASSTATSTGSGESAGATTSTATTTSEATGTGAGEAPLTTSVEGPSADGAAQPASDAAATDAWLAGIENPQLTRVYAQMKQQLKDNPNDIDANLNIIFILQNVARMRLQSGEDDKAYKTFAASAAEARKLEQSGASIPEAAGSLMATVYYNDACASGRASDQAAALKALDEAVKWGFNDFEMLRSDDDLVSVRESAGFNDKLAGWEAAVAEVAKIQVMAELASFKSFPFDFEVTDVDGTAHKLSDYKGKVVIVDIWGTWCPPCRAEIPSFIKLQEKYGEQGFQIIGLNYEGKTDEATAAKVKEFMTENNMNYPCALGAESTREQVPNFEGYPTTLFIDRTGKVRMKAVGLHEYSYLEGLVTSLLAEDSGK